MDRAEIEEIARCTAQEVINKLHVYKQVYQEPATMEEALLESMGEELTASNWYRRRAAFVKDKGFPQIAAVWEEIAKDEDDHYKTFSQTLGYVQSGMKIMSPP
jgi:rubrerythrin